MHQAMITDILKPRNKHKPVSGVMSHVSVTRMNQGREVRSDYVARCERHSDLFKRAVEEG